MGMYVINYNKPSAESLLLGSFFNSRLMISYWRESSSLNSWCFSNESVSSDISYMVSMIVSLWNGSFLQNI